MPDKKKEPPPFLGNFIEPRSLKGLLHDAECEYNQIKGNASLDDELEIVNARLRAQAEFRDKPELDILNYLDCAEYMSKRTGCHLLLCIYYICYLSESPGPEEWPLEFDEKSAEKAKISFYKEDFKDAVNYAVLYNLVHPGKEWKSFYHDLIPELMEKEDNRRMTEARRMYDAINKRNEEKA